MLLRKLGLAAAAVLSASVTGCTHYTLTPPRPASMPRASAPPLPLRVGVAVDNQDSDGGYGRAGFETMQAKRVLADRGYGSFGPKFAEVLRQANVFKEIQFPLPLSRDALENIDLVIAGHFGYRFKQDPAQGAKIFLCVITGLWTGAIMTETSFHTAQGELAVRDREGREVKSYNETIEVNATSMVSAFAETSTMREGPPAAVDNLLAKLVQNIIDDRPLFERLGRRPSEAKARRRGREEGGEPAKAAAGGAWWKETAEEKGPPEPERAPARPEAVPEEAPAPEARPEPPPEAEETPKPKPWPKPSAAQDDELLP